MKLPLNWLSDYLDMSGITPEMYNHALTMSGSKIEGIENIGDEIQNVVTGKILSVDKHPDADKLKICMLDVGNETIQIVTGADNVKPGQIVPVAKDGAILPGGTKIKKGKLRGVESNGMLCSYEEIGMTKEDFPDAEYGILILDNDLPLGKDIKEVFGLDNPVAEFEITSNRPDCFSIIGLARETAVTFDRELKLHIPDVKGSGDDVNNYVKVTVNEPSLCMRYTAKMVKNVKIGPSPKWMADRLKACGIRPINNIVDITNYVLLEYGQPMHAFDLSYLEGGEINVRLAKDGEEMTTLDGEKHVLDSSMLMICDAKKPVAIAGVMGGENSEVKEDTKTVLFESATFLGSSVRITAKKNGLRTESSSRYEKGLDTENTVPALLRACELVEMLGCGDVVDGLIDEYKTKPETVKISFEPERINKFIGFDVSRDYMIKVLTDLGFVIENDIITVPSYRPDVLCFNDIAEEVARMYGYDKIPSTLMKGEATTGIKTYEQKIEERVKNTLVGCGMYETLVFSFTNPNIYDKLNLDKDDEKRNSVVISNPLGVENSIMRTTALASMMEVISRNENFNADKVKFFEIGKVYSPIEGEQLPEEKRVVTLGMFGECDFYDLKGIVEVLLSDLGITKVSFNPESENKTFHPGRCANLVIGGKVVGVLGQIHPVVCENYDVSNEVYAAEIDLDALISMAKTDKTYKKLPKFPST
ncbi:MAG: phenylalanine--tRNA ligase subunit beta, partial [Clostridia bacterium]|nr:phenylalanine--tRNA ligase subunit beta [Clostridia bacterium]